MFKRLGRVTVRAAIIAVAAGVGGAAVAYATIPDSNGVIHGCYQKTSGGLRVIDTGKGQKCAVRTETPLAWNQEGPAGPPGPVGPPGASAAYNFQGGGGLPPQVYTFVVGGTVPAGSYAITATVTLEATPNTPGASVNENVYCDLYAGSTVIYATIVSLTATGTFDPSGGPYVPVDLVGAATLSQPTAVTVQCAPDALDVHTYAGPSSMDATQVGTIGP